MPHQVKQSPTELMRYQYLGDGRKFSALDSDSVGLLYIGSLVYFFDKTTTAPLESAVFSGGRMHAAEGTTQTAPTVWYHLRDHLGSTRVIADRAGVVKERRDYYTFGRSWPTSGAITSNRYLYNGKEQQWVGNAGLLDYGARLYDPSIGRWQTLDPLADKYYTVNPYVYVGDNPIRRIDPNGKKWVDANGNAMWEYSGASSDGRYTEYATSEFKRVANAARFTESGRAAFDLIGRGPGNTQFELSPNTTLNGDDLTRGYHKIETANQYSNGKYSIHQSKMVVNEGSVSAEVSGSIPAIGETANLIKQLPEDVAADIALGSVMVHEAMHGSSNNLKQNSENAIAQKNKQPMPHDLEPEPTEWQNRFLREALDKLSERLK